LIVKLKIFQITLAMGLDGVGGAYSEA